MGAAPRITSLDQLVELVRERHQPARVVIAACAEPNAALAGLEAFAQGVGIPVFVGDVERMQAFPELAGHDFSSFTCIHEANLGLALDKALDLVQQGQADFLMKGGVKTDALLRAVLGRKGGGVGLLSHVGIFEHPRNKRLVLITDAGVNIDPSLTRKIDIIKNAVTVAQTLGLPAPKVAMLSATEKVSYQGMKSSRDGDILARLSRMGLFEPAQVGGPFALDIAVSPEKARAKGVVHPVAGQADILCVPNIVAGNVLYKAVTSLMDLPMAGVVVGASYPLVVPSRGDSELSKFYSLVLAAFLSAIRAG